MGCSKTFWRNSIVTKAANAVFTKTKKRWHSLHYGHTRYQEDPMTDVIKRLQVCFINIRIRNNGNLKNVLTTFCMYQLNFDGQDKRAYQVSGPITQSSGLILDECLPRLWCSPVGWSGPKSPFKIGHK